MSNAKRKMIENKDTEIQLYIEYALQLLYNINLLSSRVRKSQNIKLFNQQFIAHTYINHETKL